MCLLQATPRKRKQRGIALNNSKDEDEDPGTVDLIKNQKNLALKASKRSKVLCDEKLMFGLRRMNKLLQISKHSARWNFVKYRNYVLIALKAKSLLNSCCKGTNETIKPS
jgi:hypothetical protein